MISVQACYSGKNRYYLLHNKKTIQYVWHRSSNA